MHVCTVARLGSLSKPLARRFIDLKEKLVSGEIINSILHIAYDYAS